MSDFHQRGLISTLPRLQPVALDEREMQLAALAQRHPAALILPCTLDDLRRPAMREILQQIRGASYLAHIVVSINQTTAADLPEIRQILSSDPRIIPIWNDDPALLELLPEPASGKGFNLWTALGYLLHKTSCQIVLTHDTDIVNYTRELPALLALPLLEPALGYRFIKGYYPRISEENGGQLFGRVTRLFVGPLLRALVRVEGHTPLLDFLDSFRYPLSGEFAGRLADLAQFSLPAGWGLEMDLLCSVHRSLSPESVAQIDLGSNYEHKHQGLGKNDLGLTRLAAEISACLLHHLAREGVLVTPGFLAALQSAYQKSARDTIRRYRHVALLNRLEFHEDQELLLVEEFSRVLRQPATAYPPPLPAWAELQRTQPGWCAEFAKVLEARF